MLTRNFIEYQEGMTTTAGVGVLCAAGTAKSTGVNSQAVTNEPGGKSTTITISIASSALELENELELALGITAGYGFFKSKAHVDFTSKIKINEYSLWILVVARTIFPSTDYNFTGLTSDALSALNASTDQFVGTYGDAFVSSVVYGGDIFAIQEIRTYSKQEYENIKGNIEASAAIGQFNGSLDLNASSAYSSLISFATDNVYVKCNGFNVPESLAKDQLLSTIATQVNALTRANAVPLRLYVSNYSDLPKFPTGVTTPYAIGQQLVANRTQLEDQIDELEDIADDLDFLFAHPEQFTLSYTTINAQFAASKTAVAALIKTAQANLKTYLTGGNGVDGITSSTMPGTVEFPGLVTIPQIELPQRQNYTVYTLTNVQSQYNGNPLALGAVSLTDTGAPVLLTPGAQAANQRWISQSNSDGTVSYQNGATKLFLAGPANITVDPTIVQADSSAGKERLNLVVGQSDQPTGPFPTGFWFIEFFYAQSSSQNSIATPLSNSVGVNSKIVEFGWGKTTPLQNLMKWIPTPMDNLPATLTATTRKNKVAARKSGQRSAAM